MNVYHKHRGFESLGRMKSHFVKQHHKDPQVQRWHNEALKATGKKPTVVQKKAARDWHYAEPLAPGVMVEDHILKINVPQLNNNLKSVLITFIRTEGRIRKEVILEIQRQA